jgi:hypothetical protein
VYERPFALGEEGRRVHVESERVDDIFVLLNQKVLIMRVGKFTHHLCPMGFTYLMQAVVLYVT